VVARNRRKRKHKPTTEALRHGEDARHAGIHGIGVIAEIAESLTSFLLFSVPPCLRGGFFPV